MENLGRKVNTLTLSHYLFFSLALYIPLSVFDEQVLPYNNTKHIYIYYCLLFGALDANAFLQNTIARILEHFLSTTRLTRDD